MSRAGQDSDRRHQTPESESPETYTCPIDDCTRTVIGNAHHLRNHVRQSEDAAHRHRTLTEELEIVIHWEEMDWSPGVPQQEVLDR